MVACCLMRVLITGGAGFIGSHLCDAFLARGDQVFAVDNAAKGREARLDPQVRLHHADITSGREISALIGGMRLDLVCHLAARVSGRVEPGPPSRDVDVNIAATVTILQAARRAGARVLFASSAAVYGQATRSPVREDEPARPVSPYGTSKLCAEHYVSLYNTMHGTRNAVLRLANVYGPRQEPRSGGVVAVFCHELANGKHPLIYGDGSQVRDFVHVSDVCSAFIAASDSGLAGTWNVSTGAGTSIAFLAAQIAEAAGHPEATFQFAPANLAEIRWSVLDPGLAATELGWKAAISLTEGVHGTLQWMSDGMPWHGLTRWGEPGQLRLQGRQLLAQARVDLAQLVVDSAQPGYLSGQVS